ncbi:T9SS type A sorting domain-containing protein [Microvirga sp. STR05]|uniref:T9SS type A sorting domain-containing protein n=1 Tax=Hymenobacter duratus TaxID=2771356 RepID=A0ABR8JEA4_9BACT|nr:GEVED domain-containing protein [Hymenobacter duratus]MBD2713968.1 T9SS type A sorting domain-containing protein [Hymenobacter duratus]MBR7948870.1 T9SS type A sorting domain-containing protein [Microvirga sp. STR05]
MASGVQAQTVTVGSTTVPVGAPATSSYLYGPIYRSANDAGSLFNYSRYGHLYTPAELGLPAGATITALAWLKSDAGTVTGTNTFTVLLENTGLAGLGTSQMWSTLSATASPVYSSTTQQVTGVAGDYFSVTLTQPFVYTGGNLLVLTDWEKQGSASAPVNFVTNPAVGFGLGFASNLALTGATSLTNASYGDRRPTLRVTYIPGSPCAAPPTAGTAQASATSPCAGTTVALSLQGASYGTGMDYQWQESANGSAYTDIAGATNPTYTTAALTASRYYRARLTCSGQSATSAPVQVVVNVPTYAALPLAQSFESAWTDVCAMRDAPAASWRTNPASGNNAWRRDDDGISAAWTSPTVGIYTPTGSQGNRSARFHSYYAGTGGVGNLDLYVNLSAPGNKVLTFDYINTAGNDSLKILVSTDGGATFGAPVLRLGTSGTAAQGFVPQSVSLTSTSASTVVRFQGKVTTTFTTDIGVDNVALDVLSGIPNCAANFVPANNATSVARTPTITWASGGGVATSYDVYFGTTATPAFVGNQTTTSYAPGALQANTDYYYQIVPRNANGPATGCAVVKFTTTSTFTYCNTNLGAYCGAGNANITAVTISTLSNLNSGCNTTNGSGYTSYPASGTTTTTLLRGLTYQLGVTAPEAGIISAWLDFNQNGTFEASEWTQVTTSSIAGQPATVAITVPLTAPLGQTGLRIRSRLIGNVNGAGDACVNFGSGETEDYIVTIGAAPSCAPPTALNAGNITTTGATLSFVPGAAGVGFSVIYGAPGFNPATAGTTLTTTGTSVNVTGLAPNTAYQFYVVKNCGNGDVSQAAGPFSFTTACLPPTYATLPVLESFENTWASGCSTNDIPTTSWRNDPATGNTSWRRDDDGASAGWTSPTVGVYTPAASQGNRSARFHSYYAGANSVGTLDLFVNLSAAGSKRLLFDYINTAGNDSLFVFVSNDGGNTFGAAVAKLGISGTVAQGFQAQNITLAGTSATTVIRFRAKVNTAFTSDLGIDNVRVESLNGCLAPVGLAVVGTTATSASVSWVSAGTGTYTVFYGPTGFTPGGAGSQQLTGITGTSATIPGLTASTEYQFYVRQDCGGTASSGTVGPITFRTDCVTPLYASVPFNETFESTWLSRCNTRDVPGNNWRNTPLTGNNSWRREDDGVAANWTSPTVGTYTPAGAQGSAHSARFHTYYVTSGQVGTMDLYVNMTGAGNRELSFDYINTTGSDSLTVQISTDGGLTFGPQLLRLGVAATFQPKTLTLNSSSATTVIRFRARSDYGTTDIGLDNVSISACARVSNLAVSNITGTSATVTFTPITGVSNYTVVATPATGPAVTVTGTGSPVNLTGLQGLTQYTVSVVSSCAVGQTSVPVTASFTTLIPPTVNDEPCNASALPLGTGAYGAVVSGNSLGATFTIPNGYSAIGCVLASSPKDVWFEFTTPAGSATPVSIVVSGGPAGQVRVFSAASCNGPFTQIACQGAAATNTAAGGLVVSNLSAATRYFVAVSAFGSNDPQGPFTIQAGTGVLSSKKELPGGEVSVYPNPSHTGSLTLDIRGAGSSTSGQAVLINSLGQTVLAQSVAVRAGTVKQSFDVMHLAKGLYTLRVQVAGHTITRKVVLD